MSVPNNRRRQPDSLSDGMIVGFVFFGIALLFAGIIYVGWWGGTFLSTGRNPNCLPLVDVILGLASGNLDWPDAWGWIVSVVMAAFLMAGFALVAWTIIMARSKRTRVDRAARYLGAGRDVESLSHKHAVKTARRMGVSQDANPGIYLGTNVNCGAAVWSTWEDVIVALAGPRTGKTTCFVVPSILEAPGPVLATSNKNDIVDAVRDRRSRLGRVWVFDPQNVAGERPTWWWNPLSYVTDEAKAGQMAGYFASSATTVDAKRDAYFDSVGESLLSYLLLAAAEANRPITQVWMWLTDPLDREPIDLLRERYPLIAQSLTAVIDTPDRQRAGVYGTAQNMAHVLVNEQVLAWVTPSAEAQAMFDPVNFVTSNDTLCLLSREGVGTAGAFVLSLTAAVSEAAEARARHEGGRLHKPMLAVLDEAANVCRWRELPDLYSHYGSRGIILMTFLQSWSQGVSVWGEEGMNKLWSAANLKIFGGGIAETGFLKTISDLLGDYDMIQRQVGYSHGRTSTNQSITRDTILSVDQLSALPRGRAVLIASGSRPILMKTSPWMERRNMMRGV